MSPWAVGGGALGAVAILVIVVLVLSGSSPAPAGIGTVAPASVLTPVTSPSDTVLSTVGAGDGPSQLVALPPSAILKDGAGRPLVVYVGAEFCPFCAAERWSVVMALSRFGSFSNLHLSASSSTDVSPNTSTFSFHGSTYTSQWISFTPVELEDRDQKPLETMSPQLANVFQTMDQPPYTNRALGFPFLDVGGRFTLAQTGVDPSLLAGMTWQQVADSLGDPTAPATRAIVGQANDLTAAVCLATGNQPQSACGSPTITKIEQTLGAMPVPTPVASPTP